jgi:hypothetical protein
MILLNIFGNYRYIALSGAADICTERSAIQWRNRFSYKARKINRDSLYCGTLIDYPH